MSFFLFWNQTSLQSVLQSLLVWECLWSHMCLHKLCVWSKFYWATIHDEIQVHHIHYKLRPRSDSVPVADHCARALKWTLFRHVPMSWSKNVHKQLRKGIKYQEIGGKFGVSASEKVHVITVGTDGNLFRLVPMLGHSAQVLPLVRSYSARAGAWCLN